MFPNLDSGTRQKSGGSTVETKTEPMIMATPYVKFSWWKKLFFLDHCGSYGDNNEHVFFISHCSNGKGDSSQQGFGVSLLKALLDNMPYLPAAATGGK